MVIDAKIDDVSGSGQIVGMNVLSGSQLLKISWQRLTGEDVVFDGVCHCRRVTRKRYLCVTCRIVT